ncbi:hypothetical protein EDB89DRAFT_2082260 [Lactarius sanguifluus]|nr:hypothetical protein EDB89DRAFT_2082260 [Lactarius sanguifluus]
MSLPLTETYILQDPGNVGSVQAQGVSMFYHTHALIGLTVRPQVLVSQIWNAIIISMYHGYLLSIDQVLVSQIWNAIIISMYRGYLLSIDHVQKLLYHQTDKGFKGRSGAPDFILHSVAYNSASRGASG